MVSGGNISFELYQTLIQKYNEKNYINCEVLNDL